MTRQEKLRKMVGSDKVDFTGLAGLLSEISVEFAKIKGGAEVGKTLTETFTEIAVRLDRLITRRDTLATDLADALDREAAKDAELARVREALEAICDQDAKPEEPGRYSILRSLIAQARAALQEPKP